MCQHLQRGHLAGSPSPLLRDLQTGHPDRRSMVFSFAKQTHRLSLLAGITQSKSSQRPKTDRNVGVYTVLFGAIV